MAVKTKVLLIMFDIVSIKILLFLQIININTFFTTMGSCLKICFGEEQPNKQKGAVRGENAPGQKRNSTKVEILNSGLPNIGNTCYLNSALQMIYSMKALKEKLFQTFSNIIIIIDQRMLVNNLRYEKKPYHLLLATIFHQLDQYCPEQSKKKNTMKILKQTIQTQKGWQRSGQRDIRETITFIINKLCLEDSNISKYVKIKSKIWCNCEEWKSQMVRNEIVFTFATGSCGFCHQVLQSKVISAPDYIISLVQPGKQNQSKNVEVVGSNPSSKKYSLIASSKYSGNSWSGHYTVYRRDKNQKWLHISDNTVRSSNLNPKDLQDNDIVIYECQAKIQEKMSKEP